MNLLKKFMSKNDNADYEYEGYDDEYVVPDELKVDSEEVASVSVPEETVRKEPEIRSASADKVSLKLLQPKSHIEATKIADRLKDGSIVLLDISNLRKDQAVRLVDFLSGVAYVLGGEMIKTNKSTIVVSPAGVDISSFAQETPEEPEEPAVEEEVYEEEVIEEI